MALPGLHAERSGELASREGSAAGGRREVRELAMGSKETRAMCIEGWRVRGSIRT